MKHNYYHKCENCGALLDPGEACNCEADQNHEQQRQKTETKAGTTNDLFFDLLEESYAVG